MKFIVLTTVLLAGAVFAQESTSAPADHTDEPKTRYTRHKGEHKVADHKHKEEGHYPISFIHKAISNAVFQSELVEHIAREFVQLHRKAGEHKLHGSSYQSRFGGFTRPSGHPFHRSTETKAIKVSTETRPVEAAATVSA